MPDADQIRVKLEQIFFLSQAVQILREQRHALLLPQGVRGLPAEADGSLRGLALQGVYHSLSSQHTSVVLL